MAVIVTSAAMAVEAVTMAAITVAITVATAVATIVVAVTSAETEMTETTVAETGTFLWIVSFR
jgi:predicted lipoprotein with Yx(FWY)xxD motif